MAEVDASGRINWQKLVKPGGGKEPAERDAGAPGQPWKARVDSLRVEKLGLDYTDRSRARPIRLAAKNVTVGLAAVAETHPGGVQLQLEKVALKLEQLSAGGAAQAAPLAVFDAVTVEGASGQMDLYFLNTQKGRAAVEGIERGEWRPMPDDEQPLSLMVERPNIFVLYEQNIGALTPILADELRGDTAHLFEELHRLGIGRIVLATGDRADVERSLADLRYWLSRRN